MNANMTGNEMDNGEIIHSHTACPGCGFVLNKVSEGVFFCDNCQEEWTQASIDHVYDLEARDWGDDDDVNPRSIDRF